MPRPVTGRRPDSLFDNRYRYDYIYPRGRSGETLRAYDTQNADRPCVIKRPALQDAPPIRAGQEVNILNEKRALEALRGHPVLCDLLGSGTFRIGGQSHQYIVIEMATGETLEQMLIDFAAHGERFPELEMLLILDGVLDLLQAAHDKNMIYNDVDAKHLFWDRERYILKMIDWGNVVFLDSGHVPPHVSRASDVYQVGQLLYFLLSGGRRFEAGNTAPGDDLADTVAPRLKAIINRAVNPDPSARYPDLAALRQELAEVRRPAQKHREMLVERVRQRLPNATAQNQLEELAEWLQEALQSDPGYPPARELQAELDRNLKRLAMQADLEAVRIYLESSNVSRAAHLIEELIARAGDTAAPMLYFLEDACQILGASHPPLIPSGFPPALDALLRDDASAAARLLLTTPDNRPDARKIQLLLCEALSLRIPGVVVLRPHLTRLEDSLSRAPHAERALNAARTILNRLDEPVSGSVQNLLRHYQRTADALDALTADVPEHVQPTAARARQTAEMLLDLLEVVAQTALSDPSRAGNALWHASAIDPTNNAFEAINAQLTNFHTDLDELRGYLPKADGADITDFLAHAIRKLKPYAAEITDPRFQSILREVEAARSAWSRAGDSIALGGKRPAVDAARQAGAALKSLAPNAAQWFEDQARRMEEAPRIEAFSPNPNCGKALADGWEAWDRGRTGEALQAGKRAADLALSDAEKLAARRLVTAAETLDTWIERDGVNSSAQTEATQRRVEGLFLPEENAIRHTFSAQMPSLQTYLRAMLKGVVDPLRDSSAAGIRLLFFDYVLRGVLSLQTEDFEGANIWREAASKAFANARIHPAFQALENGITRRQLVLEAVAALNNTRNVSQVAEARQAVRAPLAASLLEQADQSIRALEDALRRWHDGDFRAARGQLDLAIERATAAEADLNKPLTQFKAWLADLADSAEILAQARRRIDEAAHAPTITPDPALADAHNKLVDLTRRDLGEAYTAQLRQWRDTYAAVLEVYRDETLSKDDKLRLFESHFASLFIDKQPALPLMRFWREQVQKMPDAPPDVPTYSAAMLEYEPPSLREPLDQAPSAGGAALSALRAETPKLSDTRAPSRAERGPQKIAERMPPTPVSGAPRINVIESEPLEPASAQIAPIQRFERQDRQARGRGAPPVVMVGGVLALFAILAAIAVLLFGHRGAVSDDLPTPTFTPVGLGELATPNAIRLTLSAQPTATPTLAATPTPAISPTPITPSPSPLPTGELISAATLAVALQPSAIPTLSIGSTPEPTRPGVVLPTLPPDASSGEYDVLSALLTLPTERQTWDTNWFGVRDGYWEIGNRTRAPGRAPLVRIGPELLTPLFGADAASYVQRVQATITLYYYDEALLPTGQVFFGAGLESLQGQRAAVETRLIQTNIADVGMSINGRFRKSTQVSLQTVQLTAAIERGADRTLSLYLNGQLLGQSNAVYAPDVPLNIILYTSTGGVVARIEALRVTLKRPE